jgi:site-specific recombinase
MPWPPALHASKCASKVTQEALTQWGPVAAKAGTFGGRTAMALEEGPKLARRSKNADPVEALRLLLEDLLVLNSHFERLLWLEKLGVWLRAPELVPEQFRLAGESSRSAHLRFFLHVLKKYPAARESFLTNLRQALLDTNGLKLFAGSGLPREFGFLSEALERTLHRLLPRPPDETSLSELIERTFSDRDDGEWIGKLSPELLMEMAVILYFEGDVEKNPWRQIRLDMLDALTVLAADIASLGVSQDILDRLPRGELRDLPYLVLSHECDAMTSALRAGDAIPEAHRKNLARLVLGNIVACRNYNAKVIAHLEQYGVSVHLVYRLEKISAILDRIESIISILVPHGSMLTIKQVTAFVSDLAKSVHADKSLRELLRGNMRQLSRKLVERTGESGEHYIVFTGFGRRDCDPLYDHLKILGGLGRFCDVFRRCCFVAGLCWQFRSHANRWLQACNQTACAFCSRHRR